MMSNSGVISFGQKWASIENGGGCFSESYVEEYINVINDKKEKLDIRREILISFRQAPFFRVKEILEELEKITFDPDDPGKDILSQDLRTIIFALKRCRIYTQ